MGGVSPDDTMVRMKEIISNPSVLTHSSETGWVDLKVKVESLSMSYFTGCYSENDGSGVFVASP